MRPAAATPAVAARRRRGRARARSRDAGGRSRCASRSAPRGAVLVAGDGAGAGDPRAARASGDPCGAGDCFAATAAGRLAAGALPSEAVRAAVEAASRVRRRRRRRERGGPRLPAPAGAARAAARSPRGSARAAARSWPPAAASTSCTPATSRMLRAARALGDCLIVCLNSDASVRRLKGPDRPLVAAGRPRRGARRRWPASTPSRSSTRTTRARSCASCARTSGPRAATTPPPTCPRPPALAEWGGRAVIVPYVRAARRPADRRRSLARRLGARHDRARSAPSSSPAAPRGSAPPSPHAVEDAGGTAVVLDRVAAGERLRVRAGRPRRPARRRGGGAARGGASTAAWTRSSPRPGTDACGDFGDVDGDAWDRVVLVNLLGTVAVVRAALPHLERVRGRVVTVASTLGLRALPPRPPTARASSASSASRARWRSRSGDRVGVTMLVPGGMRTQLLRRPPRGVQAGARPDAQPTRGRRARACSSRCASRPASSCASCS